MLGGLSECIKYLEGFFFFILFWRHQVVVWAWYETAHKKELKTNTNYHQDQLKLYHFITRLRVYIFKLQCYLSVSFISTSSRLSHFCLVFSLPQACITITPCCWMFCGPVHLCVCLWEGRSGCWWDWPHDVSLLTVVKSSTHTPTVTGCTAPPWYTHTHTLSRSPPSCHRSSRRSTLLHPRVSLRTAAPPPALRTASPNLCRSSETEHLTFFFGLFYIKTKKKKDHLSVRNNGF